MSDLDFFLTRTHADQAPEHAPSLTHALTSLLDTLDNLSHLPTQQSEGHREALNRVHSSLKDAATALFVLIWWQDNTEAKGRIASFIANLNDRYPTVDPGAIRS